MNSRKMMHRLLWKDIVTIRPLVLAAVAGVVGFNLILWLMYPERDYSDEWSISIWIALPCFMAFGAPAMLVGTEQDSGTLDWLRTLPIGWQRVATSKLLVAIGAVLITWAVASVALMLVLAASRVGYSSEVPLPDVLDGEGLLTIAFFCSLLLLLGFFTAYLFRSPLVGLLVLVALYYFVVSSFIVFWGWDRPGPSTIMTNGIIEGMGSLSLVWLAQHLMARRRMLSPVQSFASRAATKLQSPDASHRPPYVRPSMLPLHSRPSEIASLLWQQLRQTGPLCISVLGLSVTFMVLFGMTEPLQGRPSLFYMFGLAPLFVLLGASSLGAVVFYGDNMRRRCGFFADRGISPSRIWWTRITPPAITFLLLLVSIGVIVAAIFPVDSREFLGKGFHVVALLSVLFAFGQLVSQWVDRPLPAFFAAPAYAVISLSPVFYLMEIFNAGLGVTILVVPVLLFATWRLTQQWLEGRPARSYAVHAITYTVIAVLLPCVWIVVTQLQTWATNMVAYIGVMP